MPIFDPSTGKVVGVLNSLGPDSSFAGAPAPTSTAAPAPTAPPANYLPMVESPIYGDPAMLAFIRSSGLANDVASADVARRTDNYNRALGIATDDINAQGERSRRGIAGNYESRGVYRSGAQLRAQSEQEADQARRLGAARLSTADAIGGLQSQLLQTIANNQQRAAELGLTTGQNQYQQNRLSQEGLL